MAAAVATQNGALAEQRGAITANGAGLNGYAGEADRAALSTQELSAAFAKQAEAEYSAMVAASRLEVANAALMGRNEMLLASIDQLDTGNVKLTESESAAALMSAKQAKELSTTMATVGAATAALGYFSVKTDVAFTAALTKVQGFAGAGAAATAQYRSEILKTNVDLGASATEMAQGLYYVVSAGFHGSQAMDVLRESTMAAQASQSSEVDVANAVTTSLNAYHLAGSQAAAVTDTLSRTVVLGKQQWQDLANALSAPLSVAPKLGASLADVGAAEADLTRHGFSAQQAGQDLANAMRNLLSPTSGIMGQVQVAQALGVNWKNLYDVGKNGLVPTLEAIYQAASQHAAPSILQVAQRTGESTTQAVRLADALQTPNQRLKALTGSAVALQVELALSTSHFSMLNQIAGQTNNALGTTARAFDIWKKSPQGQIDELKASLEDLGIALSAGMVPVLRDVDHLLIPLIQDFTSFASHHAQVVEAAVAIGLAIGGIGLVMKGVMALSGPFEALLGISRFALPLGGSAVMSTTAAPGLLSPLLSGLALAGIGGVGGYFGGQAIGNAIGGNTGAQFGSDIGAGAGLGAGLGFMVGGPLGAGIGAAVGGLGGLTIAALTSSSALDRMAAAAEQNLIHEKTTRAQLLQEAQKTLPHKQFEAMLDHLKGEMSSGAYKDMMRKAFPPLTPAEIAHREALIPGVAGYGHDMQFYVPPAPEGFANVPQWAMPYVRQMETLVKQHKIGEGGLYQSGAAGELLMAAQQHKATGLYEQIMRQVGQVANAYEPGTPPNMELQIAATHRASASIADQSKYITQRLQEQQTHAETRQVVEQARKIEASLNKGGGADLTFQLKLQNLQQLEIERVGEFATALEKGKGDLDKLSAAASTSVSTYERINEANQQATAYAAQRTQYFGVALSDTTTFLNTKTADALGKLTFGIADNKAALDQLSTQDISYLQRQHELVVAGEKAQVQAYLASGRFGEALSARTQYLQTEFTGASSQVTLALLGMASGLQSATDRAVSYARSQYQQQIATDVANERIYRAAGLFGEALDARTTQLQAQQKELVGFLTFRDLGQSVSGHHRESMSASAEAAQAQRNLSQTTQDLVKSEGNLYQSGNQLHDSLMANVGYLSGPVNHALTTFVQSVGSASLHLSNFSKQGTAPYTSGFVGGGHTGSLLSSFIKYADHNTGKQFMDEFGYQCTVLAADWLKVQGKQIPNVRTAWQFSSSPLYKTLMSPGFIGPPSANEVRAAQVQAGDELIWKRNFEGITGSAGHVDIFYKFGRQGGQLGFWTFDENWGASSERGNPPHLVWHPLGQLEGSNPAIAGWLNTPDTSGAIPKDWTSMPSGLRGTGAAKYWSTILADSQKTGTPWQALLDIANNESSLFSNPKTQSAMGGIHGPGANQGLSPVAIREQIMYAAQLLESPAYKALGSWQDRLQMYSGGAYSNGPFGLPGEGQGAAARSHPDFFQQMFGPIPESANKLVEANRKLFETERAQTEAQVQAAASAHDFYDAMNSLNQLLTERFGDSVGQITKELLTGVNTAKAWRDAHGSPNRRR